VINLPPRHLKSLLASVAFPAWVLGDEPSAEILLRHPRVMMPKAFVGMTTSERSSTT
jgi:hypothetical protein